MSNQLRNAALPAFLGLLLPAAAHADLHHRSVWLQGAAGPAFGFADYDLDDESGVISIVADVQGLSSELLEGRLVGASGEILCTLPPVAGGATVFGAAALTPEQVASVFVGATRIVIATSNFPQGEIDGPIGAGGLIALTAPFSGAQVVPPVAGPAHGSAFGSSSVNGGASVSGQLHDLVGAITAVELWRDGWLGEQGTFVTSIQTLGNPSPNTITFSHIIPTPTTELRRDLHDGLCYLLVRTSAHPEGELRAQLRRPTLGDDYCTGRPNSVSTWGARLSLSGSPRAAANDVTAHAVNLPAGKIVLPIAGLGTGHVFDPGGRGGMLCVAGAGVGRLGLHAGIASAQGTFDTALDLSGFPIGGGLQSAAPGMRLNLQLWYRDPQGPTSANFSSAVSLVFH